MRQREGVRKGEASKDTGRQKKLEQSIKTKERSNDHYSVMIGNKLNKEMNLIINTKNTEEKAETDFKTDVDILAGKGRVHHICTLFIFSLYF